MPDYKIIKDMCVQWIRNYFRENGPTCNAIIGISGGKDSSTVAALCVEALGKDRVIGVLMPQGVQSDIDYSQDLVEFLGIKNLTINIGPTVLTLLNAVRDGVGITSSNTRINLPARIRMSTLFAVSQTMNGRVANTCNLSEDWVGYATIFGDAAGQFSPLGKLTVTEVKAVARELGLPEKFIEKIPTDGLCRQTDEEKLGFTYDVLDEYIRTGVCEDPITKDKIDKMHKANKFKMEPMPAFDLGIFSIQ